MLTLIWCSTRNIMSNCIPTKSMTFINLNICVGVKQLLILISSPLSTFICFQLLLAIFGETLNRCSASYLFCNLKKGKLGGKSVKVIPGVNRVKLGVNRVKPGVNRVKPGVNRVSTGVNQVKLGPNYLGPCSLITKFPD